MKNRFFPVFFYYILIAIAASAAAPYDAVDLSTSASVISLFSFTNGYPEVEKHDISDGPAAAVISSLEPRTFQPWTTQIHAAGFIRSSAGVVIVVNSGYPLLFISDNKGALLSPDRSTVDDYMALTNGLSTGTLFVDSAGQPSIHFYRDRFFGSSPEVSGTKNSRQGPVVMKLDYDGSGNFSIEVPEYSFGRENPEWEPVELIRRGDKNLIAWKYSDDKKTRFRYIVHGEDGTAVDEINGEFFRDEYSLENMNNGPFALRGFERAIREDAVGGLPGDTGELYLRLTATGPGPGDAPQLWSSTPGGRFGPRPPVQLAACQDGGLWYILHEKELFVCGTDISVYRLPGLPEGFSYTDLYVEGPNILFCWEEQRFPLTGRSGMILAEMRDILD